MRDEFSETQYDMTSNPPCGVAVFGHICRYPDNHFSMPISRNDLISSP